MIESRDGVRIHYDDGVELETFGGGWLDDIQCAVQCSVGGPIPVSISGCELAFDLRFNSGVQTMPTNLRAST